MHSVKGKRSTQEDAHIVLVKPSARAGPAALPTLSNSQGSSVGKLRPLSNGAVEEPASRARKGSLLERFVRARDASKVSPVPVPPPRPVHQPAAHYDLVAIFDGHGGARAADFCADQVPPMLERCSGDASLTLSEAMRKTLVNVDAEFLATAKAEKLADGTTAVMVAVTGDARLVHANVGDSESVLCRHASHRSPAPPRGDDDDDDDGDGDDDNAPREQITAASIAVIPLSEIHNPKRNAKEAERITANGGKLWQGRLCHPGIAPENGSLAVSRSIGDVLFRDTSFTQGKPAALTCDPYVMEQPVSKDDLFVVLACDGVWDVMTHRAACVIVLEELMSRNNPQHAAEALVAEALAKNSTDNITVIVLVFRDLVA